MPEDRATSGFVIEVTPMGAFAGAMFAVAALALAAAVGTRCLPDRATQGDDRPATRSLREITQGPAITYNNLPVDSGDPPVPLPAGN